MSLHVNVAIAYIVGLSALCTTLSWPMNYIHKLLLQMQYQF